MINLVIVECIYLQSSFVYAKCLCDIVIVIRSRTVLFLSSLYTCTSVVRLFRCLFVSIFIWWHA